MLANFFEKTKLLNTAVVGILFSLFYYSYFFLNESPITIGYFGGKNVFALLLHLFFIFCLGFISIQKKISKDNLFASLALLFLYGIFPQSFLVDKTLLVMFLFVLMYRRISGFYNDINMNGKLFDSGFFVGVTFLLLNWTLLYFILVYAAIAMIKKPSFRFFVIPLVGAMLPVLFFFTYCYTYDMMPYFLGNFSFQIPQKIAISVFDYVGFGIVGVLVLFSVISQFSKTLLVSNEYRNHYVICLLHLFVGIALFLLNPTEDGTQVMYFFVPSAFFIGKYIKSFKTKVRKDLVLLGLFIISYVFLVIR